MSEINESNDLPFICIEVDGFNNPNKLAQRFDEFFPGRIIRLVINKQYSSIFYLGNNVWVSKKKYDNVPHISFKIEFEDCVDDFFDEKHLQILMFLDVSYKNLKVVRNLKIGDVSFPGLFFSDGNHHIFDEFMILDLETISNLFQKNLNAKTMIDLSNEMDGLLILTTEQNIFGDIYD